MREKHRKGLSYKQPWALCSISFTCPSILSLDWIMQTYIKLSLSACTCTQYRHCIGIHVLLSQCSADILAGHYSDFRKSSC